MSGAQVLEHPTTLRPSAAPGLPVRMLYGFMLLALPLQSAFVVDVGATVRLSYVAGSLAFLLAFAAGHLRHPRRLRVLQYLLMFLVVAFASTAFTFGAEVKSIQVAGVRGSLLRPVIQPLQILLMTGLLYLVLNRTRTPADLNGAARWVMAGALLAIAYGLYEVVALARGLPYLDIRNALNTDFSLGHREQGLSFEGFSIPRARSTFQEPLNFANFLLFAVPLAFAALGWARGRWRAVAGLTVIGGVVVFLLTTSRGALIAAAAAAVSLLVFVRGPRSFVRGVLRAALLAAPLLVLFAVVLMRLVPGLGLAHVVGLFSQRVSMGLDNPGRVISDEAWQAFLSHPILGVGFGNLPFHMTVSSLDGYLLVDAPNAYLRLLAETGVIGTLFYLTFLGSTLVGLVRMGRTRHVSGTVRLFACAVFFGIVADAVQRLSFVGIATDTHLWVLLGLALAIIRMGRADVPAVPIHG